jgi:outer membrane protein assembly factor BamB
MLRSWAVWLLLLGVIPLSQASDWPQFRGPHGWGVSLDKDIPLQWSATQNLRWKVKLPGRGLSNPVIAQGRVYVTACSGLQQDRLHVLCFDAQTGEPLWERQLWATGNTTCHPKTNMAAPTPVTDGARVWALFASGDLVCFDKAGHMLWYRPLCKEFPSISNQVGMAASPILHQDRLILPLENAGVESFVAAMDKGTGKMLWQVKRPREINWTTPCIWSSTDRAMGPW